MVGDLADAPDEELAALGLKVRTFLSDRNSNAVR